MSKDIKRKYREAGLTPPEGKGIHTKKFHKYAIGIKKSHPEYSMTRAYKIAMGMLGAGKAVKKLHRKS